MADIRTIFKIILVIVGFISLTLGIMGVFIPMLPTTPLVLLAAACFSRSSVKFYTMLLDNRLMGKYIRNYREGRGISLKIKILALLTLWITMVYSVCFLLSILFVKLLLVVTAVGVTIHILSLKTAR